MNNNNNNVQSTDEFDNQSINDFEDQFLNELEVTELEDRLELNQAPKCIIL